MKEVQVLQATKTATSSRARAIGKGVQIDRVRVGAYCRVSKDTDHQLGSFETQKAYYEKVISENNEWIMAGIFADEGITGTKTEKRAEFLRMIDLCQKGEIDLILTKSISRFARNTMDTLRYVRMLKEKNIAVIFEKENINTMDMNGEMLLTILSSLAQQEVESLSGNVNKGLQMKMSMGQLIGFSGCLGYNYHPENKAISINEEEAETVRLIYDLYLQGYGGNSIREMLTELGYKNKDGVVKWSNGGILCIIGNEKYKGDLLLGKTFTTDPISKRRLANMGEQNQYYIENHHEPIISKEIWAKAEEIRLKRSKNKVVKSNGYRERYTRQYSFSSMCECGYCGIKLSRRTRHSNSMYQKPVWHCMNATKNGIAKCPNCKAIDEKILEGAFLEAFHMLADNFQDVLSSVLDTVGEVLKDDGDYRKKKQLDKDIAAIESKKSRMTDMLVDGTISKEAYDQKTAEIMRKHHTLTETRNLLSTNVNSQNTISKRMAELRKTLETSDPLDAFDRIVFDSIVEKVIVGGFHEDGTADPYKLTFVLKDNELGVIPEARKRLRDKAKG